MSKHYAYMVRCSDNSIYSGYAVDPYKREKVHNSGKGAKYTRTRLPVKLVYYEEFDNKVEAMKREYAFKQYTHLQKEKIIRERQEKKMKVILASKSPGRKELMDLLGIEYKVMVSNADETLEEGLTYEEQSKRLGYIKAKAVFNETIGDRIIIGSDTMVLKDGKLYGKPHNKQEAVDMLNNLKNSKHQVFTSIAILVQKENEYQEYVDCDITDVYLSDMTNEEIESWIETGEVYDKAGAYAIQSRFSAFVEKIDGSYFTVVGLPINKVYQILKQYV